MMPKFRQLVIGGLSCSKFCYYPKNTGTTLHQDAPTERRYDGDDDSEGDDDGSSDKYEELVLLVAVVDRVPGARSFFQLCCPFSTQQLVIEGGQGDMVFILAPEKAMKQGHGSWHQGGEGERIFFEFPLRAAGSKDKLESLVEGFLNDVDKMLKDPRSPSLSGADFQRQHPFDKMKNSAGRSRSGDLPVEAPERRDDVGLPLGWVVYKKPPTNYIYCAPGGIHYSSAKAALASLGLTNQRSRNQRSRKRSRKGVGLRKGSRKGLALSPNPDIFSPVPEDKRLEIDLPKDWEVLYNVTDRQYKIRSPGGKIYYSITTALASLGRGPTSPTPLIFSPVPEDKRLKIDLPKDWEVFKHVKDGSYKIKSPGGKIYYSIKKAKDALKKADDESDKRRNKRAKK